MRHLKTSNYIFNHYGKHKMSETVFYVNRTGSLMRISAYEGLTLLHILEPSVLKGGIELNKLYIKGRCHYSINATDLNASLFIELIGKIVLLYYGPVIIDFSNMNPLTNMLYSFIKSYYVHEEADNLLYVYSRIYK